MVYITGDMHGDESRLYDKEWRKLKSGDVLIVCGDFGFLWDDSPRERSTLKYLGSRKFTVCFLDGAHENFELIKKYRQTVWKGGKVHRISGNLFHLMRGEIFEIEGNKIFTFGGGESLDKDIRVEQQHWWKAELPSPNEMARAVEKLDECAGQIDYVLTHEPPSLVKSAMLLRTGDADHVNKLNGFLEEIARFCTYKQWYFGSLHEDRRITPRHTCMFNKILPIDTYIYENNKAEQLSFFEDDIETEQPKKKKRSKVKNEA
jgi:hypothetical protein